MSYGVLECDIVMLQNHMLMICNKKGGLFMLGPVFLFPNTMFNKLLRNAQGNSCVSEVLILSLLCPTVLSVIHAANSLRAFCMCPASDEP